MQVSARDNNVDQALRALKRRLQRDGVFHKMKLKQHFEKPSEKKTRLKAEAIRRSRKLARKKAQREGMMEITSSSFGQHLLVSDFGANGKTPQKDWKTPEAQPRGGCRFSALC